MRVRLRMVVRVIVLMVVIVMMFMLMLVMVFMVVIVMVFMLMIVMMIVFVAMGMVVFVVGVFLDAVHGHGDVRAADAALLRGLPLNAHPRHAEAVHLVDKGIRRVDQLRQRAHQHVARRAHVALDVQRFHV